jgi:hypothetical protein
MTRRPIIDPLDPTADMEAWVNTSRGTRGVWHYAGAYGETRLEQVPGGGTFHLTPAERRFNMTKAHKAEMCMFRNGTFVLQSAPEDDPDVEALRESPAGMTDEAVVELVNAHHKTFAKALGEMSSPVALERVLATALSEGVSVGKVDAVRRRLAEIDPASASSTESGATADPAAAGVDETPSTIDPGIRGPQKVDIYDDAAFGAGDAVAAG